MQKEESLAHITQAESEAVKEFDAAGGRIENSSQAGASRRNLSKMDRAKFNRRSLGVKKQRIVKPAEIVKMTYLETVRRCERLPRRFAAGA